MYIYIYVDPLKSRMQLNRLVIKISDISIELTCEHINVGKRDQSSTVCIKYCCCCCSKSERIGTFSASPRQGEKMSNCLGGIIGCKY